MKLVRIAALALALVMIAVSIPSCGKKEEVKLTNVFKETVLANPDGYSEDDNLQIVNLFAGGGKMYIACNIYNRKSGDGREFLLEMLPDGSFGSELDIQPEQSEDGNSGSYMMNLVIADDGTLWALYEHYSYSEEEGYSQYFSIRHYTDPVSGKYDSVVLDMFSDPETGENFYINNMLPLSDGSVILSSYMGIKVMTPDGKVVDVDLGLEEGTFDIQNVMKLGDKVYITLYKFDGDGKTVTHIFDETTGTLGEEVVLTESSNDLYNIMLAPGYDFYIRDNTAVWGCNIGGEKTEVFNFINSDVNVGTMGTLVPKSADEFYVISYDNNTGMANLLRYNRIPDDQVANREIITLAVSRLNYNLRENVINFNKSSDKYRITVTDYSIYNTDDDWEAGTTRLNSDIVSGKIPDILLINSSMPYESYVAKRLFTDLYELMDADPEFNRADYLENIFDAYAIDGKLYSLVSSFTLSTYVAKTELVEGLDNWTSDQFMKFAKDHPDLRMFDYQYNRSQFMSQMMLFGKDNFVDRKTGACSFDSPEFRSLLEFAKSLDVDDYYSNLNLEDQDQDFWMEHDNRFKDDKVLLYQTSVYNPGDFYRDIYYMMGTHEVTPIGFPCDEGNGSLIMANEEYAISRRSKVKEGAWEFLKSFLSEEKQMPTETEWGYYNYPTNGIPMLKKALEKHFEIAMTPPEENQNGGGMIGIETMPAYGKDVVVDDYNPWQDYVMTEEEAAAIRKLIDGAKQISRSDNKLNTIITEETEAYFSGQKTLDNIVGIIQNRAETYIAESR